MLKNLSVSIARGDGLISDKEHPLEKEIKTHSSILAQKSHGQRSLAGSSPWGHKQLDMIEQLSTHRVSVIMNLQIPFGNSLS